MRLVGALGVVAVMLTATACDEASTQDPNSRPTTTDDQSTGDTTQDAAQSGDLYFYPPVEGAELTVSDLGSVESVVTVAGVEDGAAGKTVRIAQVISGEDWFDVEASYTTASDGSLILDVDTFFAGMVFDQEVTTTASGDDMVIPSIADMEQGATSEGTSVLTLSAGGVEVRNEISFTVSGAGYETITTALGTFETYVVHVDMTMQSSMGVSADGTMRYWFVPGFGWVRQENVIDGETVVQEVTASTVSP